MWVYVCVCVYFCGCRRVFKGSWVVEVGFLFCLVCFVLCLLEDVFFFLFLSTCVLILFYRLPIKVKLMNAIKGVDLCNSDPVYFAI